MEIIKMQENGLTYGLSDDISKQIAKFEIEIKQLKEKEDELKKAILAEMEKANILQINTDELLISYVQPTYKETFDSKKFREDHPDLYDEYIKMSDVKSSIRIKVKENAEDKAKLDKIQEIID